MREGDEVHRAPWRSPIVAMSAAPPGMLLK
jgi:hypothetical protein